MSATWFNWGARWHMLLTRDGDKVTVRCGAVFEVEGDGITVSMEEMPPEPCSHCMLQWGETVMIEEPLEDCFKRGYAPAPPLTDDEIAAIAGSKPESTPAR